MSLPSFVQLPHAGFAFRFGWLGQLVDACPTATCGHRPPGPVWWFLDAAAPEGLLCWACFRGAALLRVDDVENYRCDRCGYVKPGDCAPVVLRHPDRRRVLVSAGLCSDCFAAAGMVKL